MSQFAVPDQSRDADIKAVIEDYLQARTALLALGRELPERIGGNDNIIGRIGEFLGMRFLEALGRAPRKAEGLSNPGYDLIDGDSYIQVKAITQENRRGCSVRLTPGLNQLLLIELGEHYTPIRIGLLTRKQHQKAIAEGFAKTDLPVVRLSMLSPKGLIGIYGDVYDAEKIAELGV